MTEITNMSEELEMFVKELMFQLRWTGNDQIRTSTLINCIERAAKKVMEGVDEGPDEGDGYDNEWK